MKEKITDTSKQIYFKSPYSNTLASKAVKKIQKIVRKYLK